MSCCSSGGEEGARNKNINRDLQTDRKNMGRMVKLLLLGAGDSGKSTIAKQMKILYLNGYTEEERKNIIPAIYANILSSMKDILKGVQRYNIDLAPEIKEIANAVINLPSSTTLNKEISTMLTQLYNDPNVQIMLKKNNELQLHDHLDYMLNRLGAITESNYVPTVEDILKVRVRTTGIMEISYQIEQIQFSVMDMGGQRSERRKWIFFFEGVTAVIFVLALNEYDMRLREDPNVNRMHESLDLFKKIINNQYFQNTPIIFFLNKTDLFREKITRSDLRACFPEYTGGPEYQKALKFITDKFISFDMNQKRTIFAHDTCATDTQSLRKVFEDVRIVLTQKILNDIVGL